MNRIKKQENSEMKNFVIQLFADIINEIKIMFKNCE